MEAAGTQRAQEKVTQSATVRIQNGVAQPEGALFAWAQFGEVKFLNEDFDDYLILLVPKTPDQSGSIALTLRARDSVSFTSIVAVEILYYISVKSDPTELIATGKGGGPIKFEMVKVELFAGVGGPVKGGN